MTGLPLRARGALADLDEPTRRALLEREGADPRSVLDDVLPIQEQVREGGDGALVELTERFDGVRPTTIRVPPEAVLDAYLEQPKELQEALRDAAERIRRFHEAQLPPEEDTMEVEPGVSAGRRVLPVDRAGCYVPGGRAAYPSTVLMTAVPARVAGVDEVVVATPPDPSTGRPPSLVLAACHVADVDHVVNVGGAQAILAMAHGTPAVPACDAVVGPGNVYVTAAKLLASARVRTDAPAGPSEVLVVADATAEPGSVAAELLAQAEHDPHASSVLITTEPTLVDAVADALLELLQDAPRASVISESLEARGALLTTATLDEAVAFANAHGPEHLALHVEDPSKVLEEITSYGSAFLGPRSSVAFGDYGAGPNHVLPTGGLARGMSGLSVDVFLRRPTHLDLTRDGAANLTDATVALAEAEGLPGHAHAARTAAHGGNEP